MGGQSEIEALIPTDAAVLSCNSFKPHQDYCIRVVVLQLHSISCCPQVTLQRRIRACRLTRTFVEERNVLSDWGTRQS